MGSISKSFNGNFNFLNRANLYILAGANFTMTDGRFNCIIQNSYGDYVRLCSYSISLAAKKKPTTNNSNQVAQSSSTVYVYGQLLMAHALTLYSVGILSLFSLPSLSPSLLSSMPPLTSRRDLLSSQQLRHCAHYKRSRGRQS